MSFAAALRYAIRSLYKSPLFTLVAVFSLALGIGANTAVFTLLDQAILRFLPVQDPGSLAQLKEVGAYYGSNTGMNALSYPIYRDFLEQNQVFSGMFCSATKPFSLTFNGRNERAMGEVVSGTYFDVLGIRPALGRLFTAADDKTRDGAPYAVLGYDYWQNRFGGDTSVVGHEILVNNHKFNIVGVSARGYQGVAPLFSAQIYVPIMMAGQVTQENKPFDDRRRRWVQVFGRLKPGVSRSQAKASLQPIFHRILEMEVQQKEFARASAYTRAQFLRMTLDVMPGGGGQNITKQFLEAPLWAMMAMVGLVLLIACANVANLMIARATSRQKEIAIRISLGASRARIVRQLLLESALLSFGGGLLGLLISAVSMRLLMRIMPHIEPPLKFITVPDPRVLLFALIVCLGTALLFGLAPALQASRGDVAPTLKDQANAVSAGGNAGWRKLLVCFQVSLSLLLLIGAGLFVRTLQNLKNLSPGFEVSSLIAFDLDPTLSGYDADRAKLFYRGLTEKMRSTPGVRAAALSVVAPLNFDEWDSTVTVEGYASKPGEDMNPWVNYVSPDFFRTLKIPIFAGRDFLDRDIVGAPQVAIVNENFAHHYFGDRSPIGHRIGMGGDPGTKTDIEIIGVVRDIRYQTMRQAPPRQVFFPYLQNKWATGMTAYVRTDMDPNSMFNVLRGAVHQLDANLPMYQLRTEERQVNDSLAVERLAASLSTAFGILATVLAAIGLYGVMAFLVTRRTREIGIRMALGALSSNVVWMVLREVMVVVAVGIAIGLPCALAVTRLVRNQLFGMSPYDPSVICFSLLGIAVLAGLSGYLPARRASRVDPLIALRYE